jgi:hypothetical protein
MQEGNAATRAPVPSVDDPAFDEHMRRIVAGAGRRYREEHARLVVLGIIDEHGNLLKTPPKPGRLSGSPPGGNPAC